MPFKLRASPSTRRVAETAVRSRLAVWLILVFLVSAGKARAQELSNEIVVSLPPNTVHVELIRLSKLRALQSYPALRKQYTASRLADVEVSLSRLGIQDTDIDQILLAWQPVVEGSEKIDGPPTPPADVDKDGGFAQNRWPTLFGGLAAGRFDLQSIAKNAAEKHVPAISFDESRAYCVSGETAACIVPFHESLGAFGNQRSLKQIVEAREGKGPNLVASPRFLKLVDHVPPEAAVWGVAIDSGIVDWFSSWPLVQGDMQLDWQQVLKSVEALQYSLTLGEKIHLTLKLDCKDFQTAAFLAQGFRGLRVLQAWMWQKRNPNQSNPLENIDILSSDDEIVITLTTTEGTLRNSNLFSSHPEEQ